MGGNVHFMKLTEDPFERIHSGHKKMELRLYDSKRRGLDLDDYIIFRKLPDETDEVAVRVRSLHRYKSFRELFKELPKEQLGIALGLSVDEAVKNMREYYSESDEKRYGVLGIGIELCDPEMVYLRLEQICEAEHERYFPDGVK